ncbi:hypothetical protein CEXT_515491 [Caerostris extrusa]|uniref:Uncharacterized protein n=1 Tax=Caerostris extrusa TaxID=172846 RepID=A0AAV4Q3X4_CAEEX|nr:hypothetical protein CEXT_515491 [Caerostris extrusa]
MVNDSGRALQEKALSLDADLYLEQPEILLKYQRFKNSYDALWDVINLQKSLIVTIAEVVVSYVVLVGTTRRDADPSFMYVAERTKADAASRKAAAMLAILHTVVLQASTHCTR